MQRFKLILLFLCFCSGYTNTEAQSPSINDDTITSAIDLDYNAVIASISFEQSFQENSDNEENFLKYVVGFRSNLKFSDVSEASKASKTAILKSNKIPFKDKILLQRTQFYSSYALDEFDLV